MVKIAGILAGSAGIWVKGSFYVASFTTKIFKLYHDWTGWRLQSLLITIKCQDNWF